MRWRGIVWLRSGFGEVMVIKGFLGAVALTTRVDKNLVLLIGWLCIREIRRFLFDKFFLGNGNVTLSWIGGCSLLISLVGLLIREHVAFLDGQRQLPLVGWRNPLVGVVFRGSFSPRMYCTYLHTIYQS